MMIYAGIPWLGVMMLGYCFGTLYSTDFGVARRKRLLNAIGIALLLLFVLLRSFNFYGDPDHWSTQKNGAGAHRTRMPPKRTSEACSIDRRKGDPCQTGGLALCPWRVFQPRLFCYPRPLQVAASEAHNVRPK
jgi:hypothetical protein